MWCWLIFYRSCVQLGRLGCHASIGHEEECVWQHWRSCRAHAHGDSIWSSGEILSSTQNVMWSRFQSYNSWIRRFVLQRWVFSSATRILSPALWWHVAWWRFVISSFSCTVYMRYALFWYFMQHRLVFCYENVRYNLSVSSSRFKQSKTLEDGTDSYLKTTLRNCRYKLCKTPVEHRSCRNLGNIIPLYLFMPTHHFLPLHV